MTLLSGLATEGSEGERATTTAAVPTPVAATAERQNSVASITIGLIGMGFMAGALFAPWARGIKILDVSNFQVRELPFLAEPLLLPLGVVALVLIPMPALLRRGLLIGVGAQSALLYVGYGFAPLVQKSLYGNPGAGGFLGLVGAVLVFAAGVAARTRTAREFNPLHPMWAPAPIATAPVTGLPNPTETCPDCAESVQAEAKFCRFCGYDFVERLSRRSMRARD